MFKDFLDDGGKFLQNIQYDLKAMLELFEASNLSMEGENLLEVAKNFSTGILRSIDSNTEDKLAKQIAYALELPSQWRVDWYDVKNNIHGYENDDTVLKLAKINFNVIQATHQKEIRDISRWWENLGIADSLSFTRNRIVESYLWTVGVAFEPEFGNLRKWLTKVIKLVLIIDDVYDVYGSLDELELFTVAVNRWDFVFIQSLPECMKICFRMLYDTTNEIAFEIQREKKWKLVLPLLREVWAGFCNALLVEARWYNKAYTPSLQEYLENGLISSSGIVLSLYAILSATNAVEEDVIEFWKNSQELIYNTSLIIRLCNDQGTSTVELERGDAPSSIFCFMKEAHVTEEIARKHIRSIISSTWSKINKQYFTTQSPVFIPFLKCTTNTARVAHFIYKNGDGFGAQDRETRDQVLAMLVEPSAVK